MRMLILGAATLVAGLVVVNAAPNNASAQTLDEEMRPTAGQYQASLQLLAVDLPDAPPQVTDMMGSMMNRDFDYCLTPEEVEEGYQSVMNRAQQGECSYERFTASNGQIDAAMTCDVDGRAMTIEMTGTGSATSSDVTMTMSGDFGIGPGTMTMRIAQERVGDCS
ncbi:MAG: DUF3617 domain-containing protein [Erythrobacter sp.]